MRSGSNSRSLTDGVAIPTGRPRPSADGPFDDVTIPPARCTPCTRLVEGPHPPPHSPAGGEPLDEVRWVGTEHQRMAHAGTATDAGAGSYPIGRRVKLPVP